MENYSLSDIAAVTDGGFGGNNGGIWTLLILFALLGGGFGFGGNRANAATTEDLASGFNFNSLQGKTNDILAAVNGVNQNLGNAICTSTYELASKIDNCCCNTQMAIKDLTATVVAESAATRSMMQQDKIESLQNQINQLQLNNAMCGVVRYPTATTYATACNPFFGSSCNNCAY